MNTALVGAHVLLVSASHSSKNFTSNKLQSYIFFTEISTFSVSEIEVLSLAHSCCRVSSYGKGIDVLVVVVAPRSMEAGIGLDLLSVGDDGPSSDVGVERVDGFTVVSNVFLPPLLNALCVDELFDGCESSCVDSLSEDIFRP